MRTAVLIGHLLLSLLSLAGMQAPSIASAESATCRALWSAARAVRCELDGRRKCPASSSPAERVDEINRLAIAEGRYQVESLNYDRSRSRDFDRSRSRNAIDDMDASGEVCLADIRERIGAAKERLQSVYTDEFLWSAVDDVHREFGIQVIIQDDFGTIQPGAPWSHRFSYERAMINYGYQITRFLQN